MLITPSSLKPLSSGLCHPLTFLLPPWNLYFPPFIGMQEVYVAIHRIKEKTQSGREAGWGFNEKTIWG